MNYGEKQETQKKHQAFIAKKQQQRRERMAGIRAKPKEQRNPKTMLDKAHSIIKGKIGKMGTDALYVLNEVLHYRFRMFATWNLVGLFFLESIAI